MPNKDRKKRKAAYDKWYAENKEKRAAYKKTLLDGRRERRWRFAMWESAHMTEDVKEMFERMQFVNSVRDLEDPLFIVELNGKRRRETLTEPLPEW